MIGPPCSRDQRRQGESSTIGVAARERQGKYGGRDDKRNKIGKMDKGKGGSGKAKTAIFSLTLSGGQTVVDFVWRP
jgi:hypothetical protein